MASLSLSLGAWRPVLRKIENASDKEVAITVDDAPTKEALPEMLDILARFGMTATFFVSGFRAVQHPGLVQSIVQGGHAVYAHGWDHIRLDRQPMERLVDDMTRAEALLASHRPTPYPYLVRLPYNGGYRNAKVHRTLARWKPGCQIAHWRLSTEDHAIATSSVNAGEVVDRAKAEVRRVLERPDLAGAILLMHDQPVNDLPEGGLKALASVEVMKQLVEGLVQKGMTSVALRSARRAPFISSFVLP